jgi:hypothetical protein
MKVLSLFTLLILLLAFSACSSVSYKSDYDRSVDFSTYKTYKWYEGKQPDDDLSRNPLVKKRIRVSVDKALQDKGFVLAEGDQADFVVVIHAGVEERMQVYNTGSYGWYDPWWGPYGGRTDVSYYEEGTLVVDIVGAEKKELAWRGMATATIREHTDSDEMQAYFDQVVKNLVKDFPPAK